MLTLLMLILSHPQDIHASDTQSVVITSEEVTESLELKDYVYPKDIMNLLRTPSEVFEDPECIRKHYLGEQAMIRAVIGDRLSRLSLRPKLYDETRIEVDGDYTLLLGGPEGSLKLGGTMVWCVLKEGAQIVDTQEAKKIVRKAYMNSKATRKALGQ